MKKLFIILPSILLILVVSFYLYRKNANNNKSDRFIYDSYEQKWEQSNNEQKDPMDSDRQTIINSDDNKDGLHNKTVIRAYFSGYDDKEQKLKLRVMIPFTSGSLFEAAEAKLSPSQIIYCAPTIYTDPNNGKQFETKRLVIPVKNDSTLWIPTEKNISFDEFVNKSDENTFLYLQLTKDYDQQSLNYIKKIIVTGLCD